MNIRKLSFVLLVALISAFGSVGLYKLMESPQNAAAQFDYGEYRAEFANWANLTPPGDIDFVSAAALTTPGVVHVTNTTSKTSHSAPSNPFEEFFGTPRGGPRGGGKSSGSGVIISPDGYIVTNNHVIENSDKLEVALSNKKRYSATLVGTDPSSDIALIKIDASNLPYIPFANSDDVRVGEWVLAVGNPFDLESTVTAGIVSAKSRSINILGGKSSTPIESFIQTDAAVNPGNSGGALVNTKGALIGINTAIIAPSGTFTGYSFAVPANLVKKVVADIRDFGEVKRGFLGVNIRDLEGDLAEDKGLVGVSGVYVDNVLPNSAAQKAGINPGDVITHINDNKVTSSPELQEQVALFRPKDEISVRYLRAGKERTTSVVLKGAGDTRTTRLEMPDDEGPSSIMDDLGAEFEPLSTREKNRLNKDAGLKVSEINAGKIRTYTGIKQGFVITEVNNQPVSSVRELEGAIKTKKGMISIEGFYPDYPNRQFFYTFSY